MIYKITSYVYIWIRGYGLGGIGHVVGNVGVWFKGYGLEGMIY
jgi:hypothetical protein